jgi:hypothetical protein
VQAHPYSLLLLGSASLPRLLFAGRNDTLRSYYPLFPCHDLSNTKIRRIIFRHPNSEPGAVLARVRAIAPAIIPAQISAITGVSPQVFSAHQFNDLRVEEREAWRWASAVTLVTGGRPRHIERLSTALRGQPTSTDALLNPQYDLNTVIDHIDHIDGDVGAQDPNLRGVFNAVMTQWQRQNEVSHCALPLRCADHIEVRAHSLHSLRCCSVARAVWCVQNVLSGIRPYGSREEKDDRPLCEWHHCSPLTGANVQAAAAQAAAMNVTGDFDVLAERLCLAGLLIGEPAIGAWAPASPLVYIRWAANTNSGNHNRYRCEWVDQAADSFAQISGTVAAAAVANVKTG